MNQSLSIAGPNWLLKSKGLSASGTHCCVAATRFGSTHSKTNRQPLMSKDTTSWLQRCANYFSFLALFHFRALKSERRTSRILQFDRTGARVFSSSQRPDGLWGPPSGVKRPRREASYSTPSSVQVKNDGTIPPLPHMSSWNNA
jgi:hypothetical protein